MNISTFFTKNTANVNKSTIIISKYQWAILNTSIVNSEGHYDYILMCDTMLDKNNKLILTKKTIGNTIFLSDAQMMEIKNLNNITDEYYIIKLENTRIDVPYYSSDLVKIKYNFKPKDKEELQELIKTLIKERGLKADLNDIDVSEITDMSFLFHSSCFNGNISEWNTSNVEYMHKMFYNANFNNDISKWNTSKVKDMDEMFMASHFNNDISDWDVSNVKTMCKMFANSVFNADISKWNMSKVKDISYMFANSQFNSDISDWDDSNVENSTGIFYNCGFNTKTISNWKFKDGSCINEYN